MLTDSGTLQESERPTEDLGYLIRRQLVEAYLIDVLDESKLPLMRLLAASKVLSYTKNYENRFTQVITDVTAKRDDLKRLLGVL